MKKLTFVFIAFLTLGIFTANAQKIIDLKQGEKVTIQNIDTPAKTVTVPRPITRQRPVIVNNYPRVQDSRVNDYIMQQNNILLNALVTNLRSVPVVTTIAPASTSEGLSSNYLLLACTILLLAGMILIAYYLFRRPNVAATASSVPQPASPHTEIHIHVHGSRAEVHSNRTYKKLTNADIKHDDSKRNGTTANSSEQIR
jgi:hypothetical protein